MATVSTLEKTPLSGSTPGAPPVRRPLNWKHKTLLVLLGIFLAHVALEIGLRAVGFIYFHEKQQRRSQHSKSSFVILSVGDSCTYGVGSSNAETMSYPAQLQHLIRQQAPDADVYVEKMGFPGANSSQIANRLEGFLQLHHPDLMILLIGNNAIWNLNESNAYLFADNSTFSSRVTLRFAILMDSLRVARLYKQLFLAFDDDRKARLTAMKGVLPTDRHYQKGVALFGDMAKVQNMLEHNIGGMIKLAEKKGTKVMIMGYHSPSHMGETEYLKKAVKNLGQEIVDLDPWFRQAEKMNLKVSFADSWHPNDLGYAIYARVIYNELVKRGYLKAKPLEKIVTPDLKAIK